MWRDFKKNSLTKKDREDLRLALKLGVDWIALSFVETANDMYRELKKYLDADIIFMFDFEEYHPRLVQYEHIHLSEEKRLAVKNRIFQYGYHLFEKKIKLKEKYLSSLEVDLTNYKETREVLTYYHPKRVIHLAARVGGIEDNMNYPIDYLETNLAIDTNVLKASYEQGVDFTETSNGTYPMKLYENTNVPIPQETYSPEDLEKIFLGYNQQDFFHPDFTRDECETLIKKYRSVMENKIYTRLYPDELGRWYWTTNRPLY